MEEGKKLTDKMWKVCEAKQGSSIAKNEFVKEINKAYKSVASLNEINNG